MIRRAEAADRAAVERIVRDAYGIYVERIGKPPAPVLDDYAALIADGAVSVLEDADGRLAAIIVLLPKPDHLLVCFDCDDRLVLDESGLPEVRLCNFELVRRIGDQPN